MIRKFTKFTLVFALASLCSFSLWAQKPPLNHDVYDGWESLGGANISKDARYLYFMVSPQQGDAVLHIKDAQRHHTLGTVDRAASVDFSPSGQYLTMLIKPLFSETRQARIEKKRGDDMPKDSLGIFSLQHQSLIKIPAVKSYKLPEEKGDYFAYLADQELPQEEPAKADTSAAEARPARGNASARKKTETRLFLYHLGQGVDTSFTRVDSYFFSKDGNDLFFVRTAAEKDSVGADAGIYHFHIPTKTAKHISSGKGTYKGLSFAESGTKLAFLAYKGDDDALNKVHDIYVYRLDEADTARVWVGSGTAGIPAGWQVGDGGSLQFSQDGKRLFFGIKPEPLVKDTTLVEFEHAKVDIWHWNEDYLQTQQMANLRRDMNKTYTAVIALDEGSSVLPLADERFPDLRLASEGDQHYALGTTDFGRRVESQWLASTYQDVYLVSTTTGERTMIVENMRGSVSFSPQGKHVIWFDRSDGNWYSYTVTNGQKRLLNEGILTPFANEDHDSPDDPNGYGIAGWSENDE